MSEVRVRRRRLLAGGVASVVLVTGGAVVAVRGLDDSPADASDNDGAATATGTAEVTRKDLQEYEELSGTLGFGDPVEVVLTAQGTITALPPLGTVIDRGQGVVEVDGRWIPLWFGGSSTPTRRTAPTSRRSRPTWWPSASPPPTR